MMKISKKSVNRAIEYLKSNDAPKTETEKNQNDVEHRIDLHCKDPLGLRSRHHRITSFSKNLVLSEMKSHVSRRDWHQTRQLFLSLLNRSTDIEPLIWRYLLIFTLYGSKENLKHLVQLLENCIGSQSSDTAAILKHFLTLPERK